jgi:hypothetical protein
VLLQPDILQAENVSVVLLIAFKHIQEQRKRCPPLKWEEAEDGRAETELSNHVF